MHKFKMSNCTVQTQLKIQIPTFYQNPKKVQFTVKMPKSPPKLSKKRGFRQRYQKEKSTKAG